MEILSDESLEQWKQELNQPYDLTGNLISLQEATVSVRGSTVLQLTSVGIWGLAGMWS